jgi:hypothetical protein
MSEMLDRVAEALWIEDVREEDDCDFFGEFEFLREREKYRQRARAILKVMIEPTEEMRRAAMEAFVATRAPVAAAERALSAQYDDPQDAAFCAGVSTGYRQGRIEELFEVWRAMIQTALNEDTEREQAR